MTYLYVSERNYWNIRTSGGRCVHEHVTSGGGRRLFPRYYSVSCLVFPENNIPVVIILIPCMLLKIIIV